MKIVRIQVVRLRLVRKGIKILIKSRWVLEDQTVWIGHTCVGPTIAAMTGWHPVMWLSCACITIVDSRLESFLLFIFLFSLFRLVICFSLFVRPKLLLVHYPNFILLTFSRNFFKLKQQNWSISTITLLFFIFLK